MAFQRHDYPADIVLLGIALPIVWILTVATKKGVSLKEYVDRSFLVLPHSCYVDNTFIISYSHNVVLLHSGEHSDILSFLY